LKDQITVFVDSGGKLRTRGGKGVAEEAETMMTQLTAAIATATDDDPSQPHPLESVISGFDNNVPGKNQFFVELSNIHKEQSAKTADVEMKDDAPVGPKKPRSRKASKSSAAALASEFVQTISVP